MIFRILQIKFHHPDLYISCQSTGGHSAGREGGEGGRTEGGKEVPSEVPCWDNTNISPFSHCFIHTCAGLGQYSGLSVFSFEYHIYQL